MRRQKKTYDPIAAQMAMSASETKRITRPELGWCSGIVLGGFVMVGVAPSGLDVCGSTGRGADSGGTPSGGADR